MRRGLDIPLVPPVMLLRSKNFFRNSLRSAAPPTPEQADSAISKPLGFSPGRTQNPPVLWLTESACSSPEQPLSATHGRQRYNTLDFANKVVCHETAGFIGFFLPRRVLPSIGCLLPRVRCPLWIPQPTGCSSPLLETQSQRNCHPFGIPARPKRCTSTQTRNPVYCEKPHNLLSCETTAPKGS